MGALQEVVGGTMIGKIEAAATKKAESAEPKNYADVGLGEEFVELVVQKARVATKLKALEDEKSTLDLAIAAAMTDAKVFECLTPKHKVVLQPRTHSHIDAITLLEKGVKKSIIEAATKTTKSVSLRLYPVKEK